MVYIVNGEESRVFTVSKSIVSFPFFPLRLNISLFIRDLPLHSLGFSHAVHALACRDGREGITSRLPTRYDIDGFQFFFSSHSSCSSYSFCLFPFNVWNSLWPPVSPRLYSVYSFFYKRYILDRSIERLRSLAFIKGSSIEFAVEGSVARKTSNWITQLVQVLMCQDKSYRRFQLLLFSPLQSLVLCRLPLYVFPSYGNEETGDMKPIFVFLI